jgi:hypothetical protein
LANHDIFGVLPLTLADPIARVDQHHPLARLCLDRAANGGGCPGRLGESRAVCFRALKSAEIRAAAFADAGDEENHLSLLGMETGRHDQTRYGGRSQQPKGRPSSS